MVHLQGFSEHSRTRLMFVFAGLRCTPPWSAETWRSRLSFWSTLACRAWRWTTFATKTSESL